MRALKTSQSAVALTFGFLTNVRSTPRPRPPQPINPKLTLSFAPRMREYEAAVKTAAERNSVRRSIRVDIEERLPCRRVGQWDRFARCDRVEPLLAGIPGSPGEQVSHRDCDIVILSLVRSASALAA